MSDFTKVTTPAASAQAESWSWRKSPELMDRLNKVQNTERNWNHDITTIVGFFSSEAQLRAHVESYEALAETAEAR